MYAGKIVYEGLTPAGAKLVIRYPRRDDAAALCAYINALSAEYTFITLQGVVISLEDEQLYLANRLAEIDAGSSVQLLALVDDKLAGNSEIDLREGVFRHVGGFGISLARPFRGQGIGSQLTRTVIDEAVRRFEALRIVSLHAFGNNTTAIAMYRKLGFIECGRLPGGVLHRGEYVDEVQMYRCVRE